MGSRGLAGNKKLPRAYARFGRREGPPQGVFEAAKLPQKRIVLPPGRKTEPANSVHKPSLCLKNHHFSRGKSEKRDLVFAIVFVLYYDLPENATFYRGKSKIIMISPRIAGFPALREALGFCFFCWDDPPETGTLSDSA